MKKLILLGAPGSGKGTQGEQIANYYKIPKISTGDIFRMEIENNSKLGKEVNEIIGKGNLVPDEIVNEVVKNRLSHRDLESGFILDGFPRTINQAINLDLTLSKLNYELDQVVYLDVNDKEIMKRITGRRVCTKCNIQYHLIFKKPLNDDVCDSCGSLLILRKDDNKEAVLQRIKSYNLLTMPLVNYYEKKGILTKIVAIGNIDNIFNSIINKLN